MNAGWRDESARLPFGIHDVQTVIVKNRAYMVPATSAAPNLKRSFLSWAPGDSQWTVLKDLHISRYYHCLASDGVDLIWSIGGCRPEECADSGWVEEYSISRSSWSKLIGMPITNQTYRYVHVCGYWRGLVYMVCSELTTKGLDEVFHVFDTETKTWFRTNTFLRQRAYQTMSIAVPYINV